METVKLAQDAPITTIQDYNLTPVCVNQAATTVQACIPSISSRSLRRWSLLTVLLCQAAHSAPRGMIAIISNYIAG